MIDSTGFYESTGISAHEYSYPLSVPANLKIALLLVRPQTSERLLQQPRQECEQVEASL